MVERARTASIAAFAWGSFPLAAVALAGEPLLVGAVLIGLTAVDWRLVGVLEPLGWGGIVLQEVVVAALETPLMVAVHRFVVLEARGGQVRLFGVYGRFFLWLLVLNTLTTGAALLQPAAAPPGAAPEVVHDLLLHQAGAVVAFIPVLVISIRLTMLLPAVAVQAGNATLRAAWADSRSHFWAMFASLLLMFVALGFVVALATLMAWALFPGAWMQDRLLGSLALAVLEVLTVGLGAAVASQFYMVWGRTLRAG